MTRILLPTCLVHLWQELDEITYVKCVTCYLAGSNHFLNLYDNCIKWLKHKILQIPFLLHQNLCTVSQSYFCFRRWIVISHPLTYYSTSIYCVPTVRLLLSKENSSPLILTDLFFFLSHAQILNLLFSTCFFLCV